MASPWMRSSLLRLLRNCSPLLRHLQAKLPANLLQAEQHGLDNIDRTTGRRISVFIYIYIHHTVFSFLFVAYSMCFCTRSISGIWKAFDWCYALLEWFAHSKGTFRETCEKEIAVGICCWESPKVDLPWETMSAAKKLAKLSGKKYLKRTRMGYGRTTTTVKSTEPFLCLFPDCQAGLGGPFETGTFLCNLPCLEWLDVEPGVGFEFHDLNI